jgi:hypothetical protein
METLKTPEAGQANESAKGTTQGNYNTVVQNLCSGYGQYHTPNADKKNPRPLITCTLADIEQMLATPNSVAKKSAQWFIPSTLLSRTFAAQYDDGEFWALWADIDELDGLTFADLVLVAEKIIPGDFMAYTSPSATEEKQKARLIVPLSCAVSGVEWKALQKILNDKLQAAGITPDRKSEGPGQICYLPNRGDFYAYHHEQLTGPVLSDSWADELAEEAQRQAQEEREQLAEAKGATSKPRPAATGEQAGIIDKVCQQYDLDGELQLRGYKRAGSRYRSPESTSGIPGVVRLTGDDGKERIYSHHGETDPLSNLSNEGHALDVFDVICILDHGRNVSHAVKALAPVVDKEGNDQRQRDHKAAESAAEAVEQFGSTITKDAQRIADFIHGVLMEQLQVNPDTQPDEAESLKPDAEIITRMINGAFWSGGKSKVFLLNHGESLIQFTEKDSFKFLKRTFGNVIDRAAVTALAKFLEFGGGPEAQEKARDKYISGCMGVATGAIMDHLKYTNQRESIEWRVDMFAKNSRMELLEDKARIVLTHRPLPTYARPEGYAAIIADYKEHFTRLDELIKFIVAARFVRDRKKAYLWILADSDWGKGFLIGILKEMGCCVETSMKEVEAMLEGKPVGRSAEDFKRAFVLLIDEFKTVKSELKQLQSEISLSPKNQLTCTVEVFTKLFTSAESVSSLVTENGVEDQFANRMNIFQESGDITARPLYKEVGNSRYFLSVLSYTANLLNLYITNAQKKGRPDAEAEAETWLNDFMKRYGLDTLYERFSDTLPALAAELVEYFTDGDGNMSSLVTNNHGKVYLRSPAKAVDDYLVEHYDQSQITAFRRKKDELIRLMSVDCRGYDSHRIDGKPKKAVKLKD